MKRIYGKPVLKSVPVQLGVFGEYGSTPDGGHNGGDGGGCHHGGRHGGWGWGWWGGWWDGWW
jgi:hypothetical protein